MKVVLFDLDLSHRRRTFPNLALMKLSAYHRARGDEVFFNFPLAQGGKVYVSCVFPWNARYANGRFPAGTVRGGSGLDLHSELPAEIEHIMPDYSLYPMDFSMGFTSRGCPRRCPWCIVPEKEGNIRATASIYEFWDRRYNKIILLDNNLLASPNWRSIVTCLIAEGLEVDFNQGLDIRLVDKEVVSYLKHVKARQLRFAFDDICYESSVRKGIELLTKQGIPSRKLSFYVLVGFNDDAEDAVERMRILHSYNVDVYPMIYKGANGKEPTRKIVQVDDIFWHGSHANVKKFLRLIGRLPP